MPDQDEMIAALMRPNPGGLPPPLQIDPARQLLETPGAGAFAALGAGHMAELPKRMFEESENLRQTGDYNPAPYVETALALAGGGAPAAERGALGAFGGKTLTGEDAVNSILARTAKEGTHYPAPGHSFAETPGSIEKIPLSEYKDLNAAGGKVGAYIDHATGRISYYKEAEPLFHKPSARDYATVGKIGSDPDTSGSYYAGAKNLEWINAHKNAALDAEVAKAKAVQQTQSSPWKPLPHSKGEEFPESIKTEGVPDYLPTPIPERATAAGFNVPLAHGTKVKVPFEQFSLPDEVLPDYGLQPKAEIGIHAGSPKAANRFGGNSLYSNYQNPRVYPLVMKAQNPLEMEDLGNWGPQHIEDWLSNAGLKHGFEKDEITAALKGQPALTIHDPKAIEQIQALRELIQSKGYDSIKYKNSVEDPGHTSYIALDPKQLRSPWAAFKDLDSRNLLAGLAGGAVAAPAVAPQIQDYVRALNK